MPSKWHPKWHRNRSGYEMPLHRPPGTRSSFRPRTRCRRAWRRSRFLMVSTSPSGTPTPERPRHSLSPPGRPLPSAGGRRRRTGQAGYGSRWLADRLSACATGEHQPSENCRDVRQYHDSALSLINVHPRWHPTRKLDGPRAPRVAVHHHATRSSKTDQGRWPAPTDPNHRAPSANAAHSTARKYSNAPDNRQLARPPAHHCSAGTMAKHPAAPLVRDEEAAVPAALPIGRYNAGKLRSLLDSPTHRLTCTSPWL